MPIVFEHDRATMIKNVALQTDGWLMLHQVSVDRISPSIHFTTHQNHIANLQTTDLFFTDRGLKTDFLPGLRKAATATHRHRRFVVPIQPTLDATSRGVQHNAKPSEGPAVVSNRNKEAGRQSVQHANFATNERYSPAKSHSSDSERIACWNNVAFRLSQLTPRIDVAEGAKSLLLRVGLARSPIPAKAHADGSCAATVSLSLPNGVQEALPNTVQRSVCTPKVRQFARHGVLNILVLASSSLEDELDFNLLIILPLVKMQDGSSGAQVVTAVLPSQRIHGVGPQLPQPGGVCDCGPNHLLHLKLVGTHRSFDFKRGHARVLADRALTITRHVDVGSDHG